MRPNCFDTLHSIDFRAACPTAPQNYQGPDKTHNPTSITLHYEGPAIPEAGNVAKEKQRIINDAAYHINKVWGYDNNGKPLHGNGLEYHINVLCDGSILWTRDLKDFLWHCANYEGNGNSIAIHLPLGDGQLPTTVQWQRTCDLFDALCAEYTLSKAKVYAHKEWPGAATACPGLILFSKLQEYRFIPQPAWYVTVINITPPDHLNIRQGPSTKYPIAGKLNAGDRVLVDAVKIEDQGEWLHLASGLGFISKWYTQ